MMDIDVVPIYNRRLFSNKKKWWLIAICNNMDGSREYHAKWNKSDSKGQEPYDFTHMRDIKQKATNEQTELTHLETQITAWWLPKET